MAMPLGRISADRRERDAGQIPRRRPAGPAYAAEWHTHATLLPSAAHALSAVPGAPSSPAPDPALEPARAHAAEWHTQVLLAPDRRWK